MTPTPGLDEKKLACYLNNNGLSRYGSPTATLIAGGRSNLTYAVSVDDHRWVLRRPPLGKTLDTAHDVEREYTVMAALAGSDVPVPRMIAFCHDPDYIGSQFYLMEHVEGTVLRTHQQVLDLPAADRTGLSIRLVQVLAALHRIDPRAVGLQEFGRPRGFMERQVRRWTSNLTATRDAEIQGIDELARLLADRLPTSDPSAIVHGDYRLDNCLARNGDIAAVLDWEMSTLGNPLADLATFIVYHDGLADRPNAVVESPGRLADVPALSTLLDIYAAESGIELEDLDWYLAFAWFKLAVILDGVRDRSVSGRATGGDFADVVQLIEPSVERGLAALIAGVDR
jgi:aminoglycoside phosphotransferase (APT) family kinase protein